MPVWPYKDSHSPWAILWGSRHLNPCLDELLGCGLAGEVNNQGDSGNILVGKIVALTHMGPNGKSPLRAHSRSVKRMESIIPESRDPPHNVESDGPTFPLSTRFLRAETIERQNCLQHNGLGQGLVAF